jgi:hypothetical protein
MVPIDESVCYVMFETAKLADLWRKQTGTGSTNKNLARL